MIDEKLIEKFYSKLFTIPRKRITIAIGVVTIMLASFLNGIVSKTFFAQRYFFVGLALITSLFISSRLIRLALNSRRVFFLALFILIFVEIFDFIAIHLLNNFNLIIMAPATMAAGLTMILYFTSESSALKTSVISSSILVAIYPVNFIFSFEAPHRFTAYSLTILLGVMFSFAFLRYIDRNYGKFNVKKMLKAFLLFWLTSEPKFFEKELEKLSEIKKGYVSCIRIDDVSLMSSSFHPGPLRNIGGARLVEEMLRRYGGIYMHSAVKHDSNPSTSRDVEKIVESVSCTGVKLKPLKPLKPAEIDGERFTILVFPFDRLKIVFISGKEAIDDIPEEIATFAEKVLGECIVVDCHNCHKSGYELTKEDLDELRSLIERAGGIDFDGVKEFKYAFLGKDFETKNTCGKIALLLLDYDGDKYAILMLDGNNICCDFRRDIENWFKSAGINGIVISTDNHAKTGISPKIGYMPVGSDEVERKMIADFVKEAIKTTPERTESIAYSRNEVEVKVMGNAFFKSVENAFRDVGEKAIYLFFAVILGQFAVSILLGNMIF